MNTYCQNLGILLRMARKQLGYTQQALADRLNISRSAYTYYERGATTPNMPALRTLAEILPVTPEMLFYPEKYISPAAQEPR